MPASPEFGRGMSGLDISMDVANDRAEYLAIHASAGDRTHSVHRTSHGASRYS